MDVIYEGNNNTTKFETFLMQLKKGGNKTYVVTGVAIQFKD